MPYTICAAAATAAKLPQSCPTLCDPIDGSPPGSPIPRILHGSLQHRNLLPSPVTSTTGCCFCFGSFSSFFLELFLHSFPVAYWAPTDMGSSSFVCHIFLPFHTVHGVLETRILKWFTIPFSSGPRFVRTLHHDLSGLGGPTQHGS